MEEYYGEVDETAICLECGAEVSATMLDEYGHCLDCRNPHLMQELEDIDNSID